MKILSCYSFAMIAFLLFGFSCRKHNPGINSNPVVSSTPGLSVSPGGELQLNGHPYRGVGVNYFNAFYRILISPSGLDTSYRAGFRYLKSRDIPFIRFSAGGFWPKEWNFYKTNKSLYYARFDEFVHDAEKYGIGLIPSIFWNITATSDLSGEPRNQWGNPSSKTIAFMKSYTSEVVQRYKDSPAIWGWEFGNEMNLTNDIPYTSVRPQAGTPEFRTDSDRISTADMIVALKEFANTVRTYDNHRLIFSGHSHPRGYAWHLMKSGVWKKDSLFRYKFMVGLQNPDPLNSVTMHLYPNAVNEHFTDQQSSLKSIILITQNEAAKLKKPLFLGEFGASLTLGEEKERLKFNELLSAIDELKVPLAAVWVFDYSLQNADWNITPTNSRSYMIEEIGRLNRSIQQQNP